MIFLKDIRYVIAAMTTKRLPENHSYRSAPPLVEIERADPAGSSEITEIIQRRVHSLIERIPGDRLKHLAGEDDWNLMSGLADPEVLAFSRPTARDEARERGRVLKRQLLECQPTWSAAEVAEHKGIKESSLSKRVNRGTLLAVCVNGELRFPAFQFDSRRPSGELPGVSETLSEMQLSSPWLRFSWFVTSNDRLSGDSPVEALEKGRKDAVLMVARGVGAQGGA